MSLNKAIGSILDRALAGDPAFEGFARLKTSGPDLRSYCREDAASQRQVLFYRDKWWTKEGGTLYGELFCLVPRVQRALSGQDQSLSAPDYAVPFHHFQYGLLEQAPERSWQIGPHLAPSGFEAAIAAWLDSVAARWFAQFDTMQGVIACMERHGQHVNLALVHAALGDAALSRAPLRAWMDGLPRQIERPLARLLEAGLLSPAEHVLLSRASMQREDQYRDTVDAWLASASGTPR